MDSNPGGLPATPPPLNSSLPPPLNSSLPPPPHVRENLTDQTLRGDYAINSLLRRDDMFQLNPFELQERIRWELEKERIREEIIASKIARRRMIETEVRMEMMLERESAWRGDNGYCSFPPAKAPPSTAAMQLDTRSIVSQPHTGRMLEERSGWSEESLPLQRRREMNNLNIQRMPGQFSGEDTQASSERAHFMPLREMDNFPNQRAQAQFTGEELQRSEERNPFQYRREMDSFSYHRLPVQHTREYAQLSVERNPFQHRNEVDNHTFQRMSHNFTGESAQMADKGNPFQRRQVDQLNSQRTPTQFTGEDARMSEEINHFQPIDTCILQRTPLQFTREVAHGFKEMTSIKNRRDASKFTFSRTPNTLIREDAHTSHSIKEKNAPLIKPSINISGTKRKEVAPPTSLSESHLAVINKKPKVDWSCALCQVSLSTKQALDKHLQQNEHKKLASELVAKKVLKEKNVIAKKMAKAASKTALIKKQITSPLQEKKDNAALNKFGGDRIAVAKENDKMRGTGNAIKEMKAYAHELPSSSMIRLSHEEKKITKNGDTIVDQRNFELRPAVKLAPTRKLRAEKRRQELIQKQMRGEDLRLWCEACNIFIQHGHVMDMHLQGRKHKARLKELGIAQTTSTAPILMPYIPVLSNERKVARGKEQMNRNGGVDSEVLIIDKGAQIVVLPAVEEEMKENGYALGDVPAKGGEHKMKGNGGALVDASAKLEHYEKIEDSADAHLNKPAQEERMKEDVSAKGEQEMKGNGYALVDVPAKREDYEKMVEKADALVNIPSQREGRMKENGNALVALQASPSVVEAAKKESRVAIVDTPAALNLDTGY